MRYFLLFAFLMVAFVGCRKKPLCGDPLFGCGLTYELVDAATGRDWFLGVGRPVGDSLRLLRSEYVYFSHYAQRQGSRTLLLVRLGRNTNQPETNGRYSFTQYLRVSPTDVDTVVTTLHYGAVQHGPCEDFAPVDEVGVVFNGRPTGTFRAGTAADSLDGRELRKVVHLVK